MPQTSSSICALVLPPALPHLEFCGPQLEEGKPPLVPLGTTTALCVAEQMAGAHTHTELLPQWTPMLHAAQHKWRLTPLNAEPDVHAPNETEAPALVLDEAGRVRLGPSSVYLTSLAINLAVVSPMGCLAPNILGQSCKVL